MAKHHSRRQGVRSFGTALKSGVKGAFDKMDELEKESASKEEMNKELKVVVENEEKLDEAEAKELEKTNPAEAIKKYQELNIKNPNLKKYDKRIEILERKLNK